MIAATKRHGIGGTMDADTAGKSGTGNDDARGHAAAFDSRAFLRGLDAIFDRHRASTDAEPYLQQALADAENAHDDAGLLTVLNEMMGFTDPKAGTTTTSGSFSVPLNWPRAWACRARRGG